MPAMFSQYPTKQDQPSEVRPRHVHFIGQDNNQDRAGKSQDEDNGVNWESVKRPGNSLNQGSPTSFPQRATFAK